MALQRSTWMMDDGWISEVEKEQQINNNELMRRHQRMVADDWRTFVRPPSGCQNISFSKFVSMKRESLIPFMSYLNLYVRDSIIPRFKYLFGPSRILIVVD